MALWAGSAINTNETAKVFNQLATKKSLPMVVKFNGLWYAMIGKDMAGLNQSAPGWMKSKKITGKNYEVPLLGSLDAPAGIADGASGETVGRTLSVTAADYGAAEFAIAHYGLVKAIPDSEFMRYRGDEAKTLSWIDDRYDQLMFSYENVLGTAVHANVAPSRTALGGWVYAVDNANTYGTIDRTDAANVDFAGVVNTSFGDTTLAKVQAAKNSLRKNMGMPKIFVAGETLYNKMQAQIQPYSLATFNNGDATSEFGTDDWIWAGLRGLYDQRAPSGTFGLLDPRWWELIQNDEPFTSTGVVQDITLNASHVIHTTLWIQDVCQKPNAQYKATNAS